MQVTTSGVTFRVSDQDANFWKHVNNDTWESSTYRAVASQTTPQTVFLDFGAWIGPISLFAAARGARVYSFEPDPVAASKLRENVALNPELSQRITIVEKAVWPVSGQLTFGARHAQGDSMSSIHHKTSDVTWQVDVITPEEAAALVPADSPLFLKIDIEGAEYQVIPEMGDLLTRPKLAALVSFHPRFVAGGHPRWHKTIPLTKRILDCFRGFECYLVHKNRFRRMPVVEALNNLGLAYMETRLSYMFVKR